MKTYFIISILALFLTSCTSDNVASITPKKSNSNTTTITSALLSSDVMPILNKYNCTNCHSLSNQSGGVALQPYSNLRNSALDGTLYGSMAHLSGYSPMPKGGGKSTDTELAIIKKWIDDGAQDN